MSLLMSVLLTAAVCPVGQSVTADTAGQCCWSGQVFSKMQNRCLGVPQCPGGMEAQGESCVVACPQGQLATADTGGRCCWPNQVFSNSRNVCVGVPACPPGLAASGETCVQMQQPVYTPPPPSAPGYPPAPPSNTLMPQGPVDNVGLLQAKLADLQQQQAATGYGGAILGVVLGPPCVALGWWGAGQGKETDVVWGVLLVVTGGALTILGIVEFPITAAKKSRLKKEIRETEEEIARQQRVSDSSPGRYMPPLMGMLMSVSTPVFRF